MINKLTHKIISVILTAVLLITPGAGIVAASGLAYASVTHPLVALAADAGSDVTDDTYIFDPLKDTDSYSAVLYNSTSGLPTSEANDIVQTSEGFIWIGGYSGLIRYDGANFERPRITPLIASVTCMMVDDEERLWVGTNESGIYIIERDVVYIIDEEDGLPSPVIRDMVRDSQDSPL